MLGQRRRRWTNIEIQLWVNVLCLLGVVHHCFLNGNYNNVKKTIPSFRVAMAHQAFLTTPKNTLQTQDDGWWLAQGQWMPGHSWGDVSWLLHCLSLFGRFNLYSPNRLGYFSNSPPPPPLQRLKTQHANWYDTSSKFLVQLHETKLD